MDILYFYTLSVFLSFLGNCEQPIMAKLPNASFSASNVYKQAIYDIGQIRLNTRKIGNNFGSFKMAKSDVYQYFQVGILLFLRLSNLENDFEN